MESQPDIQSGNLKNNKGKKFIMIILVLLVLGLCGYFVYNKLFIKDSNVTKESIETEEEVINNYILVPM